jgi:perosamine synthetase
MKVRLFRPYLDDNDLSSIKDVFDQNWLGLGTKVDEFEKKWSNKFGVKYSIGLNSATAALHLALAAFKFPKGKKVLIPSMTFSATAMAVIYNGLEPVFVDVEPANLTMDVNDFKNKIDEDCVAVIPVHYGGSACEMDAIVEISKKYDIRVIEDCAHTQGGMYKGKYLGTWGDIGCFSFEEKKGMTTGDGGMITLNDSDLYDYLKPMRWVGIDKDTWKRVESLTNLEDFGYHWFYEIRDIGFKYNMNNLAAALGVSQFNKLDEINNTKNNAIRRYLYNLQGCDDFQFLMDYQKNWTGSYWLFGLRVKNRSELINFLTHNQVSTGVHFTPLNQQPFFVKYSGKTPISDSLYSEILTLPLYPMMKNEEVDYVCEMIKKFFHK